MNWIKRRLRGWLVPEYNQWMYSKVKIDMFMEEIARAKSELQLVKKNITFNEPVIFLGSLRDCKVDVKPIIKPEIVLAKVDISAGLMASGYQQKIMDCIFQNLPTAIKSEQTL